MKIEILKDKCLSLVKFIQEMDGGEMMIEFRNAVELSYSKKDVKGLTRILKDLSEWAMGLTNNGKEEISSLLLNVEVEHKSTVLKIIDKEFIENDIEYQILLEYVDQYFSEKSELNILEKANILSISYSRLTVRSYRMYGLGFSKDENDYNPNAEKVSNFTTIDEFESKGSMYSGFNFDQDINERSLSNFILGSIAEKGKYNFIRFATKDMYDEAVSQIKSNSNE